MTRNLKDIYYVCKEKGFIKDDIDYKTFSEIVREFHKEVSNEVLRGYRFKPHGDLGTFNIVKDKRRGRTINWGASNKLKQLIIDRGDIPYDKEEAPNGEHWLLYYEDEIYFKWKWFKSGTTKFIKNSLYYFFKPCTKNRRTIAKVVREDDLVSELYGVYK